jgi:hypothetical protein
VSDDEARHIRALPASEAKQLAPGAHHYTAYVGPPTQYDFMGATQFRLLCALGLREHHRLLDFGCGSLRAGRLFIPYLLPERYFGVEPNRWLVEDGIARELGADAVRLKRPAFSHRADFDCSAFGVRFDYVLAQSIFSHCGRDLVARTLAAFARNTTDAAIAAVTFVVAETEADATAESGWLYPRSVAHTPAAIDALIRDAGFNGTAIPWYHPRQRWYVLSKDPSRVPRDADMAALRGVVLFDAELAASRTT